MKVNRPKTFAEFQGKTNQEIVERLKIAVSAAKKRGEPLGHVMLYGNAGCQPKGQKVLMPNGSWKNVEQIKIGDKVVSPQKEGKVISAKVIATKRYVSKIYKVVIGKKNEGPRKRINYGEFRVAAEHLLVCKCRNCGSLVNISAEKFPRTTTKQSIFAPAIKFSFKPHKISPYHLGIMLGDGSLLGGVRITNLNKEIVKEIYKLAKEFGLYVNKYRGRDYDLSSRVKKAGSNSLINELRRIGLLGKKSKEKFIPKEYLLGSIQQRLELLAGIIDTDGHKNARDGSTYSIITGSVLLAKNLHELCKSLGFGVTIRKRKCKWTYKEIKKEGFYWSLNISPQDLKIPVRVKKKQHLLRNMRWKNVRVKSMAVRSERKKEMVYGFTLNSESGWYITNDWIITHNTGKSSLAYILAKEMGSKLKTITGGTVRNHKDLWCILFDIYQAQQKNSNKILFIDEVHCLSKGDIPEEVYYGVLEDFKFFHNLGGSEIKIGSGIFEVNSNASILEPFTIIGATTAPGYLSKPLRQRFRISCFLKEYSTEDINLVVKRYAEAEKIPCEEDALAEIAKRARGNPRISVNFLLGCYDLMTSKDAEKITKDIVLRQMALEHIDREGLTDSDLKVLKTLAEHEKGLGLRNLGGCTNIHSSTIEELIEPFLKLRGYMEVRHKRFITKRGLNKLKGLA